MKRRDIGIRGLVCLCCLLIPLGNVYAGFDFTYPAIQLADGGSLPLEEVSVDFDNAGALHAVWKDNVSNVEQIYGTTVFRDGSYLGKFPAMICVPTQDYGLPHIFRNITDTSKMFAFAINRDAIPLNSLVEGAYWDLSFLPAAPGVLPLVGTAQIMSSVPIDRDQFDMISVGGIVVFAVSIYPNIVIRPYDISSQTWGVETMIPANANHTLSFPRLAMDEPGYIYLSYNSRHMMLYDNELFVVRSSSPELTGSWLSPASVATDPSIAFRAALAVEGQSLGQKTALVYLNYTLPQQIVANVALGNTWPTEGIWPGVPIVATSLSGGTDLLGPDAAYAPGGTRLYIVWADDREVSNYELYGVTSYDGGLSFGIEETLTDANVPIPEPPRIAVGTELGNLAVSFVRSEGAGKSPYILMSVGDFLDTCDNLPELFWDSYPGVNVEYSFFFSPPASYQLVNAKQRGSLLRDFGTLEQTGHVSLYFYDDPSIIGADFWVAMENANSKGVIRMLGVRNDTTQENYSYNSNGTWLDSGISRQTGWHRIQMNVNASTGLMMSLEYSPGMSASWTDPGFSSFTSISIQGGDVGSPYYVDDIQVLALPIGGLPVPATSWLFMLTGIGIIGVILAMKRR